MLCAESEVIFHFIVFVDYCIKLRCRRNFQLTVVIHNMLCTVFIFIEEIEVTAYHLGIQDFQSAGTVVKLDIFIPQGWQLMVG